MHGKMMDPDGFSCVVSMFYVVDCQLAHFVWMLTALRNFCIPRFRCGSWISTLLCKQFLVVKTGAVPPAFRTV
jgi:hypothetical protein